MNKFILEENRIKYNSKLNKLLLTLHSKQNYVLDFRLLQTYMELGLEVTQIHAGLQYSQNPWLKKFIQFNTRMRQSAQSTFEKDVFKLFSNSLFGKYIQNVKKQRKYTLTNNRQKLQKLVNTAHYTNFDIIHSNLVGVSLKQQRVMLNKPIILGAVILDLSKQYMYKFHYEVIMKAYSPKSVKVLVMDTDGILYSFLDKDPFHMIKKYPQWFDTYNFKANDPFYNPNFAQCLGRFKFVFGGELISEYISLKPKLYSILFVNDEAKKLAKGVPRQTMNLITHQDYLLCLHNYAQFSHVFYNFKSRLHNITTQLQRKTALSPFDS